MLLVGVLLVAACSGGGDGPHDLGGPTTLGTVVSQVPLSTSPVPAAADASGELDLMEVEGTDAVAALDEARGQWESEQMTDYRYVLVRPCDCTLEPERSQITVRGAVAEVAPLSGDEPVAGWTAEQIFDLIDATLAEGLRVDVRYASTGFPVRVMLDLDAIAADGGEIFHTADLERLDASG